VNRKKSRQSDGFHSDNVDDAGASRPKQCRSSGGECSHCLREGGENDTGYRRRARHSRGSRRGSSQNSIGNLATKRHKIDKSSFVFLGLRRNVKQAVHADPLLSWTPLYDGWLCLTVRSAT